MSHSDARRLKIDFREVLDCWRTFFELSASWSMAFRATRGYFIPTSWPISFIASRTLQTNILVQSVISLFFTGWKVPVWMHYFSSCRRDVANVVFPASSPKIAVDSRGGPGSSSWCFAVSVTCWRTINSWRKSGATHGDT